MPTLHVLKLGNASGLVYEVDSAWTHLCLIRCWYTNWIKASIHLASLVWHCSRCL